MDTPLDPSSDRWSSHPPPVPVETPWELPDGHARWTGALHQPAPAPVPVPVPRVLRPRFTGDASEYFRIWIVNLALTLVTLGIYTPWAKVRSRRYLYSNTLLDGEPFEYLASPLPILKGYLVVVGFVVLIWGGGILAPVVLLPGLALLGIAIPLLVYKSSGFFANNLSYRNIRFRFVGSLKEAYSIYLLLPIGVVFTFGLLAPYWTFRRKKYLHDHLALGDVRFRFGATSGDFYRLLLVGGVMALPAMVLLFVAAFLGLQAMQQAGTREMPFGYSVAQWAVMLLAWLTVGQWLQANLTNLCVDSTCADGILLHSELKTSDLIRLQVMNVLAIGCSLGLLYPWAKMRKTRYVLENVTVTTSADFGGIRSVPGVAGSATAEVAASFLDVDVDIGL